MLILGPNRGSRALAISSLGTQAFPPCPFSIPSPSKLPVFSPFSSFLLSLSSSLRSFFSAFYLPLPHVHPSFLSTFNTRCLVRREEPWRTLLGYETETVIEMQTRSCLSRKENETKIQINRCQATDLSGTASLSHLGRKDQQLSGPVRRLNANERGSPLRPEKGHKAVLLGLCT